MPLEWVLATEDFLSSETGGLLKGCDAPVHRILPRVLQQVTDADSARGVLALAHLPRGGCEVLPARARGRYLFVDRLQDPGNLGALARVAEATRTSGLALSPNTVHPNHPRALRASAGSLLRLPTAIDVEPEDLSHRLATVAPRWIALSPSAEVDLYEADLSAPMVFVVGSERGLSADLEARCESTLRVPMASPVDSLNTAVAASLVLYEAGRRD